MRLIGKYHGTLQEVGFPAVDPLAYGRGLGLALSNLTWLQTLLLLRLRDGAAWVEMGVQYGYRGRTGVRHCRCTKVSYHLAHSFPFLHIYIPHIRAHVSLLSQSGSVGSLVEQ